MSCRRRPARGRAASTSSPWRRTRLAGPGGHYKGRYRECGKGRRRDGRLRQRGRGPQAGGCDHSGDLLRRAEAACHSPHLLLHRGNSRGWRMSTAARLFFSQLTGQDGYTIIDVQLAGNATEGDVEEIRSLGGEGTTFSDRRMDNGEVRGVWYSMVIFVVRVSGCHPPSSPCSTSSTALA